MITRQRYGVRAISRRREVVPTGSIYLSRLRGHPGLCAPRAPLPTAIEVPGTIAPPTCTIQPSALIPTRRLTTGRYCYHVFLVESLSLSSLTVSIALLILQLLARSDIASKSYTECSIRAKARIVSGY